MGTKMGPSLMAYNHHQTTTMKFAAMVPPGPTGSPHQKSKPKTGTSELGAERLKEKQRWPPRGVAHGFTFHEHLLQRRNAINGVLVTNHKWYPLVMTNIAMENGPFIDGLPGFTC